jgi:hypothetical protein
MRSTSTSRRTAAKERPGLVDLKDLNLK